MPPGPKKRPGASNRGGRFRRARRTARYTVHGPGPFFLFLVHVDLDIPIKRLQQSEKPSKVERAFLHATNTDKFG